ncbi:Urease accessory protein UreF [Pseudozyma hubeiensis]|nr:Urease accessory protein UreF [Pseudozyma hubeiensis]
MSTSALTALRPKIQALRIGKGQLIPVDDDDPNQGWAWDWPEEQDRPTTSEDRDAEESEKGFWNQSSAPATTFPLGEIIQARHDQLHSRLFNS